MVVLRFLLPQCSMRETVFQPLDVRCWEGAGETDGGRVQISMQLWSLWPLLYQAYNEWAFDYFENILVPLDNFVSKGTDVFLSGQNPNYLNQVGMDTPRLSCSPASAASAPSAPIAWPWHRCS